MKIVVFEHPGFLDSKSMPRFAGMLVQACEHMGHEVHRWAPRPVFHRLFAATRAAKWAGYVDQYLLFPRWVRQQLRQASPDTLYVFADQALGPWVPLVAHLPHVIHVHDLLALRSALGRVPENPTRWSGRIYQRYIRRGFRQGRRFICISRRTQSDLIAFGGIDAAATDVVYNDLNYPFRPLGRAAAVQALRAQGLELPAQGCLVHISGGQWYKNLAGVLGLYAEYASRHEQPLPLWLIGPFTQADLARSLRPLPPQAQVRCLSGLDAATLEQVYSAAQALIFPSHAEGFGWPILEAQAAGCPVITTDDAPMNEIGGPEARYLPRLQAGSDGAAWCRAGADQLDALLQADEPERERRAAACVQWASGFAQGRALQRYLAIYREVLSPQGGA